MYKGIIYTAYNKITNKYYVGQTVRAFKERVSEHILNAKSGIKTHFYNALRKYSQEDFEWSEVCFIYDANIENLHKRLDELEIYFIRRYNSFKNGYNSTEGGGGVSGWKPTAEWIQNQRDTHLGKVFSEEHKKNISLAQKGKVITGDHLKHLREAAKLRDSTGSKNSNAKAILKLDKDWNLIKEYGSIVEAAEDIQGYKSTIKTKTSWIRKSLNNSNYMPYGFHWKLKK